jgi:hypothetical protein
MNSGPTLLDFVRHTLGTIWAVEQLLLMQRSPERKWSPAELVAELRASDLLVRKNLDVFERAGLVAPHEGGLYQFAPASELLSNTCADLAQLYRERPHTVQSAILSSPDRLQQLANAFKIRRNPS